MSKAACCLEAKHTLPQSSHEVESLDSPEGLQRLQQLSDEIYNAQIVRLTISESQALKIVKRLWPGESLLGATGGRGFAIDTADQVSVVNEILAPDIRISFGDSRHKWMIQTWPE